jgi:hypothetical protein
MSLENMNKKVIPDPLTGGEQTVYWNNEGTFMMCMPHQAMPMDKNAPRLSTKWTDNKDGTKTWESKWEYPTEDIPHEVIEPKQLPDNNKD